MRLEKFTWAVALAFALLATPLAVQAAGNADKETDLAAAAYQAGDYPQAIAHFRKVVKASPKDAMAWHFLGQSLAKTGDNAGAKSAYERVLQLQPNSLVAERTQALLSKLPDPDFRGPEMVQIPDKNYAMGKYEVTQKEWRTVMGNNPSNFSSCGDNCPVENVSYNDVQEFIQKLKQKTGKDYRLPTRSEWEDGCLGGIPKEYAAPYCGSNDINEVAWYKDNSNDTTHPVGQKLGNPSGLHDMSGNVWEWTSDCWEGSCAERILCGGSYFTGAMPYHLERTFRLPPTVRAKHTGFRLARTLP